MQKLVIDTNVLISSLLGKSYPHKIIFDLVFTGRVQLFLSPDILKEYNGVLARKKFASKLGPEIVTDILESLISSAIITEASLSLNLLKDESDNKFIDLAISIDANFLITGNTKHFPFGKFRNTQIILPGVYWNMYGTWL